MNLKGLIRKIKKGDRNAMRDVYTFYAPFLTGVIRRYIADDEEVRDILHDSFLHIFSGIKEFESIDSSSFKSWMASIATNESLQLIRKRCKFETIPLKQIEITDIPETNEIIGLGIDEIIILISQLPEKYRVVFSLYAFEHLSHSEIAEKLGIKSQTSAVQLQRARKMLIEAINLRWLRENGKEIK